jgi:hypothetical protein
MFPCIKSGRCCGYGSAATVYTTTVAALQYSELSRYTFLNFALRYCQGSVREMWPHGQIDHSAGMLMRPGVADFSCFLTSKLLVQPLIAPNDTQS